MTAIAVEEKPVRGTLLIISIVIIRALESFPVANLNKTVHSVSPYAQTAVQNEVILTAKYFKAAAHP